MRQLTVWIFDLDGVITHHEEKKITEHSFFDIFTAKLETGDLLAFNTGRSLDFVKKEIVNPLRQRFTEKNIDSSLLLNILSVAEKGAVVGEFSSELHLDMWIDPDIQVPGELVSEIRNLIKHQYSETMVFDETKHTMISTESKQGISLTDYHAAQKKALTEIKEIVGKYNTDSIHVDPSVSAIDIQKKGVGKHLGAQRILKWLDKKSIKPSRYITFGDSRTDIAMAEELEREDLRVEFVFTGEKKLLEGIDSSFPIHVTQKRYSEGTLEYLTRN